MDNKTKQEIEADICSLFQGKHLIEDQTRLYKQYTLTKKLRYAIGFDIEDNHVYYSLLKEGII